MVAVTLTTVYRVFIINFQFSPLKPQEGYYYGGP